jgi:hypothetical protein
MPRAVAVLTSSAPVILARRPGGLKNYYELYMRALEDITSFEEYLLNLVAICCRFRIATPFRLLSRSSRQCSERLTMRNFTIACSTVRESCRDCTQLRRIGLDSQWRSGCRGAVRPVQAVKCEQNRFGTLLRHFCYLRDKLPDTPPPPSMRRI